MSRALSSVRPLLGDLGLLLRLMRQTDAVRLALVIALGLVLAISEGISLLLLVPVLQGLQGDVVDVSGWPIVGLVMSQASLEMVLALFVLVILVRGLVGIWRDRVTARLRLQVLDTQRLAALDAALHARWSWLLSRRGSDIVQTVNAEVARVGFTVDIFARLTVGVFIALAITVSAIIVTPSVGALAAGVALLAALLLLPSAVTAHRMGRDQVAAGRDYAAAVTDAVASLKLVRAHESGQRWLAVLHSAMQRMADVQVRYATRSSIQRAAVSVVAATGACALVLLALGRGVGADQLIVLVVLIARLLGTTQTLATTAQQAANNLPVVATVQQLLDDALAHADPATSAAPGSAISAGPIALELSSVSFAYPGHAPVLKGVDLICTAGQVTAVTGASGVGKTTLVDLVLGLLSPQAGTIFISGVPSSPAVLREFRARLGYVPQDVHLLPGTLRENLTWSTSSPVSDAQCQRALDQACVDITDDLPDGLDTLMGERGVRLSGGQRQRVALARALLRRPDILILDEATSALDPDTEDRVLTSVQNLGITVLLVAHRETTLAHAAHVLRLEAPIPA